MAEKLLFNLIDSGLRFYKEDSQQLVDFVSQQLAHYAKHHTEWRGKYLFLNPHHYTRNLVEDNDMLEMIVIVWGPGQGSRVHDHANSNCWMAVLSGSVIEAHYRPSQDGMPYMPGDEQPNEDGSLASAELVQVNQRKGSAGDVMHIHDRIALHAVHNASDAEMAVTLHVYSPPIRVVKVFDVEAQTAILRTPGFYSIHGRPTGKQ